VNLVAVIDTGLFRDRPPTLAGSFGISLAIVRNLPNWVLENILLTEPNGFIAGLNKHLQMLVKQGSRIPSSGSSMSWKPGDLFDANQLPPKYLKMMESNLRALREYTPKHYPGRLTLIRASTRPLLHSQSADLGWSEWVTGRGWIETFWKPPVFPTRWDLDKIAPINPVFLTRADGHASIRSGMAAARRSTPTLLGD
jgi:hypothetical protein